jgi:hypothetical protein
VSPRAITPGIKHTNMKSRITVEVDFDNGNNPVIQIFSQSSTDVRDNLIRAFYQKLGSSSWCKIYFKHHYFDHEQPENDFKRIIIEPIPESDLRKEAEIMLEQFRVRDEYDKQLPK